MNHPIPPNEAERLDELISFSILHKPLSKDFEDLSKLAAFICNTEVAMINFIDEETQ